jgi:hypothetical protein
MMTYLGHLLGLEETQSIQSIEPSLTARWTQSTPAWLLFACLAAVLLALVFYTRYQRTRRGRTRVVLGVMRGLVFCLLLLILAKPVLLLHTANRPKPSLWIVLDGTDSMNVPDEMSKEERAKLAAAVGLPERVSSTDKPGKADDRPTRADYVKALLTKKDDNLLARLAERFRLKAFLVERPDGVQTIETSAEGEGRVDPQFITERMTTKGQTTALGAALDDLARRNPTTNVAGVVMISDFNQNAGPSAVEAARRLGVGVFTVGVGPLAATDIAVDLAAPPVMKKDEKSTLTAIVHQEGATGQTVSVRFTMQPLGGSGKGSRPIEIGTRGLKLEAASQSVDLPYVPKEAGQFLFAAEVDPLPEETAKENNRAQRQVTVQGDYLRLLFVEYEPTWEWRFIKEVFHRDPLVGLKGFRTFLRSADPRVRQTNELFLPTLTPPRSEFFANDVIFLGDMPASALSPLFCRMTKEFVEKFGGGLVIVSGPRFGPGQLAQTALGELMPVKVDPEARRRDRQPFELELTPLAMLSEYGFMRLGDDDAENQKAWKNLGPLAWYQPVQRKAADAEVLAVHPSDTTVDGREKQPLIAISKYGAGEVVYLGFDETWRLRKRYGELYYRKFWGQLIHRLGLRHAQGAQKRFVVHTDRQQYQSDDEVILTVGAYDANFMPLAEDKLPGSKLTAEVMLPSASSRQAGQTREIAVPQSKTGGIFEARFPVYAEGEYHVRVRDPVAKDFAGVTFRVTALSAERERPVRNAALQQAIADESGGKSYDLTTVGQLPEQIPAPSKVETAVEVVPLWSTKFIFFCVVLLMFSEWLGRKWVNLP